MPLLLPLAFVVTPQQARAMAVDVELMLLIDISGSIDNAEYALQMQGYMDAFNNPATLSAIQSGQHGRIAVRADFWSSADQYATAVDWTLISDASSANAFATALGYAGRPFQGQTAPGEAILRAIFAFDNAFESDRQVIDISGDGAHNQGLSADTAVSFALSLGIDTINGLAIEAHRPAVADGGVADFPGQTIGEWYEAHLKAGDDAFVMQVASFEDFGDAIDDKIRNEIAVVPVPAAIWLFAGAILGLMGVMRRR